MQVLVHPPLQRLTDPDDLASVRLRCRICGWWSATNTNDEAELRRRWRAHASVRCTPGHQLLALVDALRLPFEVPVVCRVCGERCGMAWLAHQAGPIEIDCCMPCFEKHFDRIRRRAAAEWLAVTTFTGPLRARAGHDDGRWRRNQ
jgi:hypothetical protein